MSVRFVSGHGLIHSRPMGDVHHPHEHGGTELLYVVKYVREARRESGRNSRVFA